MGTGKAESFNKVANIIINISGNKNTQIRYINISQNIADNYQSYTKANISRLRKIGYSKPFIEIKDGIDSYLKKIVSDKA